MVKAPGLVPVNKLCGRLRSALAPRNNGPLNASLLEDVQVKKSLGYFYTNLAAQECPTGLLKTQRDEKRQCLSMRFSGPLLPVPTDINSLYIRVIKLKKAHIAIHFGLNDQPDTLARWIPSQQSAVHESHLDMVTFPDVNDAVTVCEYMCLYGGQNLKDCVAT